MIKILSYIKDILRIYTFNIIHYVNNRFLFTYRPNSSFTRCRRCGRDIHDFNVPDTIWNEVADSTDCYCYDCFCDLYETKTNKCWRMN